MQSASTPWVLIAIAVLIVLAATFAVVRTVRR